MKEINIEEVDLSLKKMSDLTLQSIELETKLDLINNEIDSIRNKVSPLIYDERVENLFYKHRIPLLMSEIFYMMTIRKHID